MRRKQHRTHFRAGLDIPELIGQCLDRLFPGDVLELARASLARSLLWSLDTIGVVVNLESGLAPGAKSSAIHRVKRIAFDLVGLVFSSADNDAATSAAHPTRRRLPIIEARHVLLVGNEDRNQFVLRVPASRQQRGCRCSCSSEYDEFSSLHQFLSIQVPARSNSSMAYVAIDA